MKKILLILFIFIFHNSAYSQDASKKTGTAGTYELSPIFGALVFEDKSYDNSFMLGVRGLLHITKKYALEGEISFSPTSFRYNVQSEPQVKEDLNVFNLNCNFVYKYTLSPKVSSFGTAGVGFMSFMPESAESNSDLYFNFGGGLKFLFGEGYAFRIDMRQYAPSVDMRFFSPRSGNIIFSPDTSPKADVQKILQLNAGITFTF